MSDTRTPLKIDTAITVANPIRNYSDVLHRIEIHEDTERGLLVAEVQLFSDSETPSYGVILGHLKK